MSDVVDQIGKALIGRIPLMTFRNHEHQKQGARYAHPESEKPAGATPSCGPKPGVGQVGDEPDQESENRGEHQFATPGVISIHQAMGHQAGGFANQYAADGHCGSIEPPGRPSFTALSAPAHIATLRRLLHGFPLASHDAAPGARLISAWQRLAPLPFGRWLFSRFLGRMVPYSGTIGARVEVLEPGHARIRMSDRRAVRNHLRSVHAVALTNMGELTTGLATVTALPPGVKAIVVRLSTEYHAKARGQLVAECRVELPAELNDAEIQATTMIHDGEGTLVATVTALWRTRVEDS